MSKPKQVWIIMKSWSDSSDTLVAVYYSENLARSMYEVLAKHSTEFSYSLSVKEIIDHI